MRTRKKLWLNQSEPIIAIMLILMVLGMINVFSSSFVLATVNYDNPYFFLERHCIWLVVGLLLCYLFKRVDYHRWRTLMPLVMVLTLAMLAAVLVIGTTVNGARRWLTLGPLGLQPSEFAKLVSIMLAAAAIGHANKTGLAVLSPRYWLQYGVILLMALLVEFEPDMGTAVVVGGIPVLMMAVSGRLGWRWIAGGIALISAVFVAMIMSQPYRQMRVMNTFDPWADAQGAGYQTVQSLSTIGSGGFWGMGLGEGVSKYEYLPEAHTDFAFAIFCQEHGFIGAIGVFILLLLLIVAIERVAERAPDDFGQMLAFGVLILICGQGLVNILMVGGVFPVVGVPLPFISYGGSSLIVTMIAMGILLNICDQGKSPRLREQEEREREKLRAERRASAARSGFRLVK